MPDPGEPHDDPYAWPLARPVPCAICRTPTDPVLLTKSWCPDVIRGTVVDRVMWVCPACPLPGGPN